MSVGSLSSERKQNEFRAEIDAAIARHRFPWESGFHSHAPSSSRQHIPGSAHEPEHNVQAPPVHPAKSYSVSDARALNDKAPQSLGMRVNHPPHRDELSNLWHMYAINHSASPYTKQEHQHNANIYHHVKEKFGKDVADDMHRHAEALRSTGAYALRLKHHIQEQSDDSPLSGLWYAHQTHTGAYNDHPRHRIHRRLKKSIENYVLGKFGKRVKNDMVAHSQIAKMHDPYTSETRLRLRQANNIHNWLHETATRHYFALADKGVHPGAQPSESGELFSANRARSAKSVGYLRKLMRTQLVANSAADKLSKHISSNSLLQAIAKFEKEAPNADVRPIVKQYLRKYNIRGF